MESMFREFYRSPDEEFKKIWDECIFVFDANVLLHLYMYSNATSQEFLRILTNEKISERVWMPYQFAFEYQKRRLRIISEQKCSYQKLIEEISNLVKKFEKHPFLKMKSVMEPAIRSILDAKRKHPRWNEEDPIRDSLTQLFKDKIGKPFSKEELEEIYKEGQIRFSKKIPPGFLDQNKDSEAKFGDLVGWKQIMFYAKKVNKPIIFVTDEKYDDWWWRINKENFGARYELIKEINDFAGVFFLYV
jgi:predicted nucleic acid-binding protein